MEKSRTWPVGPRKGESREPLFGGHRPVMPEMLKALAAPRQSRIVLHGDST